MEGLLSALSGPTGAPSRQQPPANEPPPPAVSQAPLRAAEFSTPAKVHPLSRDVSLRDAERSPSSEPSPAATDWDAIQRLSERLDDLEIEHNRYIGRESGMHLLQGVHEHLSVNFTPGDGDTKPPLVDALFESLHATLRWTVSEMPADLGPRLIDAYYKYSEWGFTLLPRQYLEECLQNGLLDTDRSFRSLCKWRSRLASFGRRALTVHVQTMRCARQAHASSRTRDLFRSNRKSTGTRNSCKRRKDSTCFGHRWSMQRPRSLRRRFSISCRAPSP